MALNSDSGAEFLSEEHYDIIQDELNKIERILRYSSLDSFHYYMARRKKEILDSNSAHVSLTHKDMPVWEVGHKIEAEVDKKILKLAKGYYGARSRVFRVAKQAVIKAGQYAYRDRRQKKRQFRALWIARINAGARNNGLSYSRLIAGLKKASIEIDRKVLADLAVNEKAAFAAIVEKAKAVLA